MKEKLSTYHSSLVPVLACIAALLFSANFYQFLQKNLKKWWGWDFSCRTEQVHHRHKIIELKPHDRHVVIFDFDEQEIDHEMDRAHRDLERAEQALRRNMERAMRDMERLHERMEWDGNVEAQVERLHEDVLTKAQNLERLDHELRIMDLQFGQDEADHRRKHHRKHRRKRHRKSVRIRVHR